MTPVTTPADAGKTASKKTKKSAAEKMNGRARDFVEFARGLSTTFMAALDADRDSKHAPALTAAHQRAESARVAVEELQDAMGALHKAKWEPPKKRARGDWRPGDFVALKPRQVERYKAGYDVADLKSLVVESVHGAMVKARIYRDGLNGESLGLLPGYAFVRAAAPAPAKAKTEKPAAAPKTTAPAKSASAA